MSDARLRELERRWKASGTVEDEGNYLSCLLHVGRLPIERLRLAAFLQHEASAGVVREEEGGPQGLADVLLPCGSEACVRAGIALARAAMPVWTARFDHEDLPEDQRDGRPRIALEALEEWVRAPAASTLIAAWRGFLALGQSTWRALDEPDRNTTAVQAPLCVVQCLLCAGRSLCLLAAPGAALSFDPAGLPEDVGVLFTMSSHAGAGNINEMFETGAQALGLRLVGNPLSGPQTTIGAGVPRAFETLVQDLTPWLLGRGDPLLRVEPGQA